MIFEVDKDVCVSPHRHGFTEQTPAWKFPVVGRATRPPFFRMRTDRYFIGTDKDEMETFLQSLYVDFTLPAPLPLLGLAQAGADGFLQCRNRQRPMPLYIYRCPTCDLRFEHAQTIAKRRTTPCPQCGRTARLVPSTAHFVLKGTGFYVNDYPASR